MQDAFEFADDDVAIDENYSFSFFAKSNVYPDRHHPDNASLVGKRVAREFDQGLFYGSIAAYLPVGSVENVNCDVWYVEYDDGDEEDYAIVDIRVMLALYELHNNK